jgi:hypothetical protein
MPTAYPELFAALAQPFHPSQVRTRKHDGASYITARSVMNRLDTIVGPENWLAIYERWGEDAVMCHLTITLPDGSKLTKSDVGSYTSMADKNKQIDPGDDDKAGLSDSLKRAAVLFGVGRHLYGDGYPDYFGGEVPSEPQHAATHQEAKWGHQRTERPPGEQSQLPQDGNGGGQPRTGKSLYAWAASEDKKDDSLHLVKVLNAWGKSEGLPFKMIDWQPADVTRAFEAAQAHFRAFYGGGSGDE